MVFQNPFASLNPRKTVEQTLGEPLAINTKLSSAERAERIAHMMRTVGLAAGTRERGIRTCSRAASASVWRLRAR